MSKLVNEIAAMVSSAKVRAMATDCALSVTSVTWEDTARSAGSCYGPNISDMTLTTESRLMPIIRKPNFTDITADQPIEWFSVMTGNESDSSLRRVSLREYIDSISPGTRLTRERDAQILVSAQTCILPLQDGAVEFAVQLFNYQSYENNPAVLVIVASASGTSVQIVNGTTPLYFNLNGRAHLFKAVRLADHRVARSETHTGAMTKEEAVQNVIHVYQIPLKVAKRPRAGWVAESAYYESDDGHVLESCLRRVRGLDRAILSIGSEVGEYPSLNGVKLERDERFPIRCTVQHYCVTDTGDITIDQMKDIADTITRTYNGSAAVGSLVVESTEHRTTASK